MSPNHQIDSTAVRGCAINLQTGGLQAFSSQQPPNQASAVPETPAEPKVDAQARHVASDLLSNKVVGMETMQHHTVSLGPNQTVASLQTADAALGHKKLHCYDNIDIELSPDRLLEAQSVVLFSEQAWDFSQEVIRKTLHMLGYPRDKNIHVQGGPVASDEMRFYLHSPQHCGKVIVVPPMILTDLDDAILLAEAWQVEFHPTSPVPLVSAVLFNGHWIPVIAVPCD